MKKIKLLNVLGATLLAAITITMPIVLVSCSTSETPPLTPLQIYKNKISDRYVFVDQEAIDMLGTELYRTENGLNILDLSHWLGAKNIYGLNIFNKPVDKIILPDREGGQTKDMTYNSSGVYPKLNSEDVGKQLWQVYPEFALKGNFKMSLYEDYNDITYLPGLQLSENYVIQETDFNHASIDHTYRLYRKINLFPLNTFQNVSKIILDTKKNDVTKCFIDHASLPYAFSNVDKNDPELVEYNGKKYPGIIAQKELSAQAVSAIIPFSDSPITPLPTSARFLYINTVSRLWPGFVKTDKTLGEGFYYAPLHDQSLKVFFTTLEDVNQFFSKTYDKYANTPGNLSNAHIQNNYQTLLKIFPHKDSTPQNPKIDWSGIQKLSNNF